MYFEQKNENSCKHPPIVREPEVDIFPAVQKFIQPTHFTKKMLFQIEKINTFFLFSTLINFLVTKNVKNEPYVRIFCSKFIRETWDYMKSTEIAAELAARDTEAYTISPGEKDGLEYYSAFQNPFWPFFERFWPFFTE